MKRYLLRCLKEWVLLTIATVLLYKLLWLLVYYKDFSFNWFNDVFGLCGCALFTLSSLGVKHLFLRSPSPYKLSYGRLFVNGALTLIFNICLALTLDWLAEVFWPSPPVIAWQYTYIWCILSSLVVQFYLSRYYMDLIIQQQNENFTLTKNILKSQLSPHFVFNNINILLGLIEENPEAAEKFAISMAKIFRYSISSFDRNTVLLSEAIAVSKEYISILQTRYPSSIFLSVNDAAFSPQDHVLTMSMQIILENAVKHNCPSESNPLTISIYKDSDYLVIRNNLRHVTSVPDKHQDNSGIGLINLEKRYLMECGKAPSASVVEENGGKFFEINIPIIKES